MVGREGDKISTERATSVWPIVSDRGEPDGHSTDTHNRLLTQPPNARAHADNSKTRVEPWPLSLFRRESLPPLRPNFLCSTGTISYTDSPWMLGFKPPHHRWSLPFFTPRTSLIPAFWPWSQNRIETGPRRRSGGARRGRDVW